MVYRTHIHNLCDDELLEILSCCRVEDDDNWYLCHGWQKLAHVCQRWRHLMFCSWSHLDMCILLTNDSPAHIPSHLPPLPLVIAHLDRTRTMARKDVDNVHLGLQNHGRVRRVVLRAPSSSLRMWLEPINNHFPRLRDLSLVYDNGGDEPGAS
jgi:hypothetical protein